MDIPAVALLCLDQEDRSLESHTAVQRQKTLTSILVKMSYCHIWNNGHQFYHVDKYLASILLFSAKNKMLFLP